MLIKWTVVITTFVAPSSHKVGWIPMYNINLKIEKATKKRIPDVPGKVNTEAKDIKIIAQIIADKRESNSVKLNVRL